jgi:hypothetical protein
MYLVAQHVLSPTGQGEGVNAFCYLHGPNLSWLGVPPEGIPGLDPGVLATQVICVPPPGNRVRSYLDVIASDETPQAEIRRSFVTFVSHAQRERMPWLGVIGRCYFRVGIEPALANQWKREIADLYRGIEVVRLRQAG